MEQGEEPAMIPEAAEATKATEATEPAAQEDKEADTEDAHDDPGSEPEAKAEANDHDTEADTAEIEPDADAQFRRLAAWTIVAAAMACSAGEVFRILFDAFLPNLHVVPERLKERYLFSENAFYFAFAKDMRLQMQEHGVVEAFRSVMLRDNRTEAPHEIIPWQRFNLAPELAIALVCRDAKSPVECAIATARHTAVWQSLFLVAMAVRIGRPAGDLAVVDALPGLLCSSLLASHLRLDRMSFNRSFLHPMLRENFGCPMLWAQVACIGAALRGHRCYGKIALFTAGFLLMWQLAPSVLLLELHALFAVHLVGKLSVKAASRIVRSLTVGNVVAGCVMCGNGFILCSPFACLLYAWEASCFVGGGLPRISCTLVGGVALKAAFALVDDADGHMLEIARAKLSASYNTFQTRMYLCDNTYQVADWNDLVDMWSSGLLGLAALAALASLRLGDDDLLFLFLLAAQLLALACFIRRLSVLAVPALALMAASLASRRVVAGCTRRTRRIHLVLAVLLPLCSFYETHRRLQILFYPFNPLGPDFLERAEDTTRVIELLARHVPPNSTVAADMRFSAAVRLSSDLPILIHPQAESSRMRRRHEDCWQVFARAGESDVRDTLVQMAEGARVDVVVIDLGGCYARCIPKRTVWGETTEHFGLDVIAAEARSFSRTSRKFCDEARDGRGSWFVKELQTKYYLMLRLRDERLKMNERR